MRTHLALASLLLLLTSAAAAYAGQVRVSLTGTSFAPGAISLNQGDHVVWVWLTGSHTVTSGTDGSTQGDGIFNTPVLTAPANPLPAFSWKSDRTGSVPYYCGPHFAFGMVGTLTISASGVPVADFRITEVQYNVAGGADLIEIANLGAASGDLGRYRIAISGDTASLPMSSQILAPGSRVVLHANASGTQTATDVFLPTLTSLPDVAGSVALYAPNTVSGETALTNVSQIIDFVQYGGPGQANEVTAVAATLWPAGEFIPTVAAGHSIEFCGTASDRGQNSWAEVSTPNFGSDGDCLTPTVPTSWGRIKSLYR